MGLALPYAQTSLADYPDEDIEAGIGDRGEDEDDERLFDEEWDLVSDAFDDQCRWDEWEVPMHKEQPVAACDPCRSSPVLLV